MLLFCYIVCVCRGGGGGGGGGYEKRTYPLPFREHVAECGGFPGLDEGLVARGARPQDC